MLTNGIPPMHRRKRQTADASPAEPGISHLRSRAGTGYFDSCADAANRDSCRVGFNRWGIAIMAAKKFIVELEAQERARLNALISKGKAPAMTILEALDANMTMVSRVRAKLVTEGLDAVLTRKKRETPPTPEIFDGERQAK